MPSHADRVTDELIELNGLRFHFRDWESAKPDAPTLLLLHGFTGHARGWDTVAQAMRGNYHVLALDQRGHGESAWAVAPEQYGAVELVADVEAFVRALSIEHLVLLGLSMGGQAAIGFAGKRPPELHQLVIVDTGPEIDPVGAARIQAGARATSVFDSVEEAERQLLEGNPNADPGEIRHRARHNVMRTEDGKWTWRWDPALNDAASPRGRRSPEQGWALAANIAVPTLLVRGELSDILAPEVAAKMVATIPDCRLVEVPGAGHAVHQERPAGFLEALRGSI